MKNLFLGIACVLLAGCANSPKQETATSCCNDKSSMEVVLDLHRKVKPEYVTAFKEAFAKCKAGTIQESGCVDYGVYQSPQDSTEFLIYEVWKNEAELAKHGETAHLKNLLEETKDMFDSVSNKKIYVCAEAQK
ncbi:putative quinol monooxygenase [Bacteroides sp.]|uniref:putative quinol monooxygenase n=1 Tax=Bacteroides sp. TaxID=29523 RepID=UPI00262F57A1|nr:putative quinol monooxygenase [Bacteroides sp.]MDD3036531.1 putative quinol monooxygenase [Bacteroides sp.]